jgi:hypothetical protein
MTISHTKKSAIDSTQENLRTVHGFTWRSCSRARRGPRTRDARLDDELVAAPPGPPRAAVP